MTPVDNYYVALARRVGAVDAPTDPRSRIIEATTRCLVKMGLDATSIAAIAREAKLSRQTVYKYFATKEDLVAEAMRGTFEQSRARIVSRAAGSSTAASFVVELFVAVVEEFDVNPAVSPVALFLDQTSTRKRLMAFDAQSFARTFLAPVLDYVPDRAEDLEEMTETVLRFVLSVVVLPSPRTESPAALRAYLHRVLVPAVGLSGL